MKKVLVIEDNLMVRENIVELLELASYEVRSADNGRAGIDAALKWVPDLILCDILMPELDGYGVLNYVQQEPALKGIPLIFLTAKTERPEQMAGLALGAADYLSKPFDADHLIAAVKNQIVRRTLEKETVHETLKHLSHVKMRAYQLLHHLIVASAYRVITEGEFLYQEGEHPAHLYYIRKGRVRLVGRTREGRHVILREHLNGDFVGYVSILQHENYPLSAQVMEDSDVACIDLTAFEQSRFQHPEVREWFDHLLESDIADRDQILLGSRQATA